MTPEAFRLFKHLAEGASLDAARYAAELGISRAAVAKQVEQLRTAGLPVLAVHGGGDCSGDCNVNSSTYRLAWSIGLLDADEILRDDRLRDVGVEVHPCIDSTNDALFACFRHRHALLAEYQTAGRGRRGRSWISPPGCGISISYGFRFDRGLQRLGALSLVAGVVVAEALAGGGVAVNLKWPNDLVVGERKLGGLLIEIRGAGADGPSKAVIGLGINARLPRAAEAPGEYLPPDQSWTDLYAITKQALDRNRLVARLIAALDAACREFEQYGFEPFEARWAALDALRGRRVRVIGGHYEKLEGTAEGVTPRGRLRLVRCGNVFELDAGEVSIRVDE